MLYYKKKGEEKMKTQLKMQLAKNLQDIDLTEALSELHPSIIQIALERFAETAMKRRHDERININRIREILQGRN